MFTIRLEAAVAPVNCEVLAFVWRDGFFDLHKKMKRRKEKESEENHRQCPSQKTVRLLVYAICGPPEKCRKGC
jgi:hypothetical protein